MCRQTYTQLKIDLHTDQRVVSGLDASLKSCIRYLLDFFLSSFTVILKLTLNSMLGYSRFSANVCLGFTLLITKYYFTLRFWNSLLVTKHLNISFQIACLLSCKETQHWLFSWVRSLIYMNGSYHSSEHAQADRLDWKSVKNIQRKPLKALQ